MTTFLASVTLSDEYDDSNDLPVDFVAFPYCSRQCLVRDRRRDRANGTVIQTFDVYDFDETCANCGATIPAEGIDRNAIMPTGFYDDDQMYDFGCPDN